MTIHAFGFRFRAEHEDEGCGTMLITCDSQDQQLTAEVRRVVDTVTRENPSVQFDGMTYYGSDDIS